VSQDVQYEVYRLCSSANMYRHQARSSLYGTAQHPVAEGNCEECSPAGLGVGGVRLAHIGARIPASHAKGKTYDFTN
jgi:hypothetical protein